MNTTYANASFTLQVHGCLLCHSRMTEIGAYSLLLVFQVLTGSKLQATRGLLAAHSLLLPRSVNNQNVGDMRVF